MRTTEVQQVPQSIDIRDFRGEHCGPPPHLSSETLEIQGRFVDVQLRTIIYHPTRINGLDGGSIDPNGSRTMFGIYVDSGAKDQLVQLVRGPSEFSVSKSDYEWELAQEKRILEVIAEYPPKPFLASSLPRAHKTNEAIYESTAPGVLVGDAVAIVAKAYRCGELSEYDAALILTKMNLSVRHSIAQLHDLGIKHHHAHVFPGNFNIDLQTGNATLFDYTLAASKNHPDTFTEVDYPVRKTLNAENLDEDIQAFEFSWQGALEAVGLPINLLEEFDVEAMDTAIAKLEPTVVRAALRSVGLNNVSGNDVQRVIELQGTVIGNAPDISYPKDTLSERLKTKLSLAKFAVSRFFS